ncbi:Aste57867_25386 [Aphanomyces stellatus]|uniref:Aste57867_25386 protein n=1 Tax=Aphanomyces stellatus TaxID=120398 RepID=A0A485LVG4_9STRA|nr:hypothetical protein As57867_025307 [Aphanomyces stellatus]VFU02011.1 Aste57867_25386 [Aphanomyces stellatus]
MALVDTAFDAFVAHSGPHCPLTGESLYSKATIWVMHAMLLLPTSKLPFPNTDSRTMWRLWFKGDVACSNGVPYRRCTRGKGCEMSEGSWSHAKLVIKILVRLQGHSDDALEPMAEETLMDAFDRAFPRYVEQHVGEKYRKSAQPEKSCSSLRKYRQES